MRQLLSFALAFSTLGCSPDLLPSLPHLEGQWGGVEAAVTATRTNVTLVTTCDSSTFPKPAILASDGSFTVQTGPQPSMWGNVRLKFHGTLVGDTLKGTLEFEQVYQPGEWGSFDVIAIANTPGQFSHYGRLCPM
jgi:hypothetical protein